VWWSRHSARAFTTLPSITRKYRSRLLRQIHQDNAQVPTTLFRLRAPVALQLLIQGYASMRERLAEAGHKAIPLPSVDRFANLLGVRYQAVPPDTVVITPPRSTSPERVASTELAGSSIDHLSAAVDIAVDQAPDRIRSTLELEAADALDWVEQEWQEIQALPIDIEKLVGYYDRVVRTTGLDDELVRMRLAAIATALGRAADQRASDMCERLEQRAMDDQEKRPRCFDSWFWFEIAKAYAASADVFGAVRCLERAGEQEGLAVVRAELKATVEWSDDPYADVRQDAAFVAFVRRLQA
jgi:hypothetical protein